jgi:penicillin-binding protein 2
MRQSPCLTQPVRVRHNGLLSFHKFILTAVAALTAVCALEAAGIQSATSQTARSKAAARKKHRTVAPPAARFVKAASGADTAAPAAAPAVESVKDTAETPAPKKIAAGPAPAHIASGPWRVPNFADSTEGDYIDGDDMQVRRAAVDALGRLNGSVVVADPETGRVLTIVNQKLAFKSGFEPCSTIKVPVALAALSESIVDRDTVIRIYGSTTVGMTQALAKSNNYYFASLGQKLGFDRFHYYAKLFGLGEKAGLGIEGEQAGTLTRETPSNGGVGMMTSFGEGITLTPLQLTAIMGAVANGGTLYYMQYPRGQRDLLELTPRVKRHLDIAELIPDIKPGMLGAVEYGTARRAGDTHETIYGKTGTCTDPHSPTHLGWFGSFTEAGHQKLVVVVLLTGGKLVSGGAAAAVAGNVYKELDAQDFFARARVTAPVTVAAQGN